MPLPTSTFQLPDEPAAVTFAQRSSKPAAPTDLVEREFIADLFER
ncbi:hypothetical protein [Candidatus Poriferisodalis sp.]